MVILTNMKFVSLSIFFSFPIMWRQHGNNVDIPMHNIFISNDEENTNPFFKKNCKWQTPESNQVTAKYYCQVRNTHKEIVVHLQ